MSDSYYTHTLEEPVQFGETTISELKFRKPRLKDMMDMPVGNPSMGDLIRIAARLTAHPPTVFDGMSAQDGVAIARATDTLLGGGLPTGGST